MKLLLITALILIASTGLHSQQRYSLPDSAKGIDSGHYVILYDKRDTVPVFMEVVANAHLNKGLPVICINGYIIQKGFVTQSGQWAKEPTVVEVLDEKKRPLSNKILRVYQPDYNLNPVKDSLIKKGGKR